MMDKYAIEMHALFLSKEPKLLASVLEELERLKDENHSLINSVEAFSKDARAMRETVTRVHIENWQLKEALNKLTPPMTKFMSENLDK